VVAGVLVLAACGGDDDGAPESPAAGPEAAVSADSEPLTEGDALGIVEAYYAAVEVGDADAIAAVFVENVGDEFDVGELVRLWVWNAGQGTILVDRACTASNAEAGTVVVVCEYGIHQYLQRVADAPATPITETITLTAMGIQQADMSFGDPGFPANDGFNSWMSANHPQDAEAADCCGGDGSIDEARSDGELRRRYADLWAAYLEETDCTYDNIPCQTP
jgi:hypothetical protein